MSAKPQLRRLHSEIAGLAAEGVPAREIADRLGVCVSGVRKYCARHAIPLPNVKDIFPVHRAEFVEAAAVNPDAGVLAKRFGVSRPTIYQWARRVGVKLVDSYHRGFIETASGYICVPAPDHPHCDSKGYCREHVLVMEQHLGRYLTREECVHHVDGDKKNNSLENLQVMLRSDHARLHADRGDTGWTLYHNKI